MQDLEDELLYGYISEFTQKMHLMRQHILQSDKLYYKYQKESWFLDAAEVYCEAVSSLARDLMLIDLSSRGFLAFRQYILGYVQSHSFTSLLTAIQKLKIDLSTVKYCLLIQGSCITLRKYEGERDYSDEVEKVFGKFKEKAGKDYRSKFHNSPDMNHVEAGVLNIVAQLYPDIFSSLDNFYNENRDYIDKTIAVFDREIHFYIAYIEYMFRLKEAGLKFCYPQISSQDKEIYNYGGFDLALAKKLIMEKSNIVCNDFYLKDHERIFVVTGANK